MANSTVSRSLARYVRELRFEDLPADVVERAKLCVLDAIACCFGGQHLPWSRAAVGTVQAFEGRPEATVWFEGFRAPASEAAFANGVMAHSMLYEDMHLQGVAHPGPVVVPTTLAVAERATASGKELLAAVVCGYEVLCRLATALLTPAFRERCFRPTGVAGPIAAAAIAGKLGGLSEDELVNAIGVAGSCSAGINEWAWGGGTDMYYHIGFAARNGIVAAMLAQRGLLGATTILEGRAGLLHAFAADAGRVELVTAGLGSDFEIRRAYFKPAPTCGFLLELIQLAQRLIGDRRFRADEIARVWIGQHPPGKLHPGSDWRGPFATPLQAQMSNQYTLAAILLGRGVTMDQYTRYDDPAVLGLAQKIEVELDPESSALFPASALVKLRIELADGTVLEGRQEGLRYPTEDEVVAKFDGLAAAAIGRDRARALREAIWALDDGAEAADVTRLCVRPTALVV